MSDGITLEMDTTELERKLNALTIPQESEIVEQSMRAAAEPMLASVQALTPVRTSELTPHTDSAPSGALLRDMHIEYRPGPVSRVRVGPSHRYGYLARWINHGFELKTHRKSGRKMIGRVPGRHFLEQAFDASISEATEKLLSGIAEQLSDKIDGVSA